MVDDYAKALLESVYKVFDVLHMNITGECGVEPRPQAENQSREASHSRAKRDSVSAP